MLKLFLKVCRKGRKIDSHKINNIGSTLIEVVVSILVVGIVFVPLMMGLNTALKANTKSKEIMNAETVATNCLETVKAIGLKKLQGYYEKTSVESLNSKVNGYLSGDYTSVFPANEFAIGAKIAGINDTYHRDFVITNLEQGSGSEFFATLSFNDDRFTVQNNNADYISINGLGDTEKSYLCNMSASQQTYFNGLATTYGKTVDDVKASVASKVTEITIDKITDPDDPCFNGCEITATNTYTFKSGTLSNPLNTDTGVIVKSFPNIKNTIFLFYAPVNSDETKIKNMNNVAYGSGELPTETIKITKNIEEELSVYVFIQGADVKSSYSGSVSLEEGYVDPFTGNVIDPEYANASMNIEVSESTGCVTNKIGIYCPFKMNFDNVAYVFAKPSIIKEASSNDFLKLYEAKIKVYNMNGELLTEKVSTIMDGELTEE